MTNTQKDLRCSICNSPLIFVSKETIKPEGSRFMQTNNVYRCSNEECQKMKDSESEKRLQARQKKEISDKERADAIREKKILSSNAKRENSSNEQA